MGSSSVRGDHTHPWARAQVTEFVISKQRRGVPEQLYKAKWDKSEVAGSQKLDVKHDGTYLRRPKILLAEAGKTTQTPESSSQAQPGCVHRCEHSLAWLGGNPIHWSKRTSENCREQDLTGVVPMQSPSSSIMIVGGGVGAGTGRGGTGDGGITTSHKHPGAREQEAASVI